MRNSIIIAGACFLSFIIGAIVPGLIAINLYLTRPEAEAEYYRGLYDVCVGQTHQREMCLQATAKFKARDWYGLESVGWRWPID